MEIKIDSSDANRRGRLRASVRDQLRELRIQLAVLNARVGARLDFKGGDLDALDVISREGSINPSTLARRAGLHPATVTGVLDRLERDGWIARERDPADRRAVVLRLAPGRASEVLRLYAGMNGALEEICARYSDTELDVIADFLRRTTEAGRLATEQLT
jgi:DNA-binding MarR family transcriptional regulator